MPAPKLRINLRRRAPGIGRWIYRARVVVPLASQVGYNWPYANQAGLTLPRKVGRQETSKAPNEAIRQIPDSELTKSLCFSSAYLLILNSQHGN